MVPNTGRLIRPHQNNSTSIVIHLHLILPHALACWFLLLNGRAVRVSTCGSSSPFALCEGLTAIAVADGIIFKNKAFALGCYYLPGSLISGTLFVRNSYKSPHYGSISFFPFVQFFYAYLAQLSTTNKESSIIGLWRPGTDSNRRPPA